MYSALRTMAMARWTTESVFAITGGEIVAVGGSGMAQGFGDESTQCSALVNFDEWVDAGETITLTDSDGKEVFSYKVDKKFNSVVISTSDMKQGG